MGTIERCGSSRADELVLNQLRKLMATSADIEGLAILSVDGFHIASILPSTIGENSIRFISAASAVIASSGINFTQAIGQRADHDTKIYIKSTFGYVIVVPSEDSILMVICKEGTQLGFLFLGGGNPALSPSRDPILPRKPPDALSAKAKRHYDGEE